MALTYTVYKKPNSSKYYVAYFDPERMKRVYEATQFRIDDPTGEKKAHRYGASKSQHTAAFQRGARKEYFLTWVEKFLRERYRGATQTKTLDRYLSAWDNWRVFLAEQKVEHPQGLDYGAVLEFVRWRSAQRRHNGKKITRNTALCDVRVMSVIMREAVRRGFATVNPCERLGIQRDAPKEKEEITDRQVELIRRRLAEREKDTPLRDRWMTTSFELAIHHGMRLTETQIPFSAIDLERMTLTITAKGQNGRKKVFTVTIHPGVRQLLTDLKAKGAKQTCVLPQMAAKLWHGFFHEDPETSNLSFHCTRVTVITRLARAGVPIQQAMAYVGHASQTIHRVYQKLKAQDLTAATAAVSYSSA